MLRRFVLQVSGSAAFVSLVAVAGHVWGESPEASQPATTYPAPIRGGLEPLATRLDLLFRENRTDIKQSLAESDFFPDHVLSVEVIHPAAARPVTQVVHALPAAPPTPAPASQATHSEPVAEPAVVGDQPDARPIRQIAHWAPADIGEMPTVDEPSPPVAPPVVAMQPAATEQPATAAPLPIPSSPAGAANTTFANQPATIWVESSSPLQPATNVSLQPITSQAVATAPAEAPPASIPPMPVNVLRRGNMMVAERIAAESATAPAANTAASIDQAQMRQALEASSADTQAAVPAATLPTALPSALPTATAAPQPFEQPADRYATSLAPAAPASNDASFNPLRSRAAGPGSSQAVNPLRAGR